MMKKIALLLFLIFVSYSLMYAKTNRHSLGSSHATINSTSTSTSTSTYTIRNRTSHHTLQNSSNITATTTQSNAISPNNTANATTSPNNTANATVNPNNTANATVNPNNKTINATTSPQNKTINATSSDNKTANTTVNPNNKTINETTKPENSTASKVDNSTSKASDVNAGVSKDDPTAYGWNCNSKGRCWMWCGDKDRIAAAKNDFHKQTDGKWCYTTAEISCKTREDCKTQSKCVDNCSARWGQ